MSSAISAALSLFSSNAQARWATREDADFEIEFDHQSVDIHGDASSVTHVETQMKILKENARGSIGIRRIYYTPVTTSIKIVSAKTILNGKEYPVLRSQIQDKPLASSDKAFDEVRQLMIAYPKPEIGAEIYLKYVITDKAAIPGFYRAYFDAGTMAPEKNSSLSIRSALPLYFQKNDPEQVLGFKENRKGKLYTAEVALLKPTFKRVVDEEYSQLNPKALSWIEVSTIKDWAQLVQTQLTEWEKVLSEPLPPLYERIRKKAEAQKSDVDRINTVTSELASLITYVGDWRTIRGGYFPRPLATVAEARHADCKDFSAGTVAILRKLGYKAYPALVHRGFSIPYESPGDLPGGFNHAIVRVYTPQKNYWVDPTNFASYAQGIFPDIENRRSLVLTSKPVLEHIPANAPESGSTLIARTIRPAGDSQSTFEVEARVAVSGTQALKFTGAALQHSKETFDRQFLGAYATLNKANRWSVTSPDLTSRVVRDLEFGLHYNEDTVLRTSAGPAYPLYGHFLYAATAVQASTRVSDLFLGSPEVLHREATLVEMEKVGNFPLDCNIRSRWFEATRKVTDAPDGIRIADKLEIKQSIIPNQDLKSIEFADARKNLIQCFEGSTLVYQPKKPFFRRLASQSHSGLFAWFHSLFGSTALAK